MKKSVRVLLVLVSSYIMIQLVSDILALKIIDLGFWDLTITAGMILYPFSFTVRDFLHKSIGKSNIQFLIGVTAVLNILTSLLLFLVVKLPPASFWLLQEEFKMVLLPVWRITLASIIAELVSQLIDTYIFSKVFQKTKKLFNSIFFSNLFGALVDSILFVLIAFIGTMDFDYICEIIITQTVLKIALSMTLTPFLSRVPIKISTDQI
jgi:hypothetical protein